MRSSALALVLAALSAVASGHALAPRHASVAATRPLIRHPAATASAKPTPQQTARDEKTPSGGAKLAVAMAAPAAFLTLFSGMPVEAAVPGVEAVPSALAAYGHYLGLVLVTLALGTERVLIKEDMTEKEFDLMANADILYGLAGTLMTYTGYLRVAQYGKGWEFYQHEPIFWVKIVLFSVLGAASFFPTTKIIQLAVSKRNPETPYTPMSPKLVSRMTSILNAELLAICSIPLAATLMARGVGYADWLPWQAPAGLVALTLFGLGGKYIKEALDWSEDDVPVKAAPADSS